MDLSYQKYFEASPCYLTVQDRNLRLIDANKRFREHFGDIEGRYCYQVYKHRSEKCERCPVDRTFRDGEGHRSEEKVTNLKGKDISVIVYTTPVFDTNGEIEAVMEMSADITEVKILQEQLRESQERYRLIFDQVPCFISIQDKNMRIVEANRRFSAAFGAAMGCKCFNVYKHRDEECYPCAVQQTFEDGEVHSSEEVITTTNGESINALVRTAPIRDTAGEIQSVMEMSTDITSIRQLQSQLESVGLLVSSISHGIKGLLSGLDGGIYLVNSGMSKKDDKRMTKGWEMVQRNVGRIRSMVLNILYYSKEREPNREEISVVDLANEVLGLVKSRANDEGVVLRTNIDTDAGTMEADIAAMRALLVNLMENGVDACRVDKKKDQHWLSLKVKGYEYFVEFDITENGIGMDQETREKAFSLFFSSKGAKGTGLGLFISSKIAEAHRGSITLESELNQGSSFIVRIPRKFAGPERNIVPLEKGVTHGFE